MTFHIPEWVLWCIGIPVGLVLLWCAYIGAYIFFGSLGRRSFL